MRSALKMRTEKGLLRFMLMTVLVFAVGFLLILLIMSMRHSITFSGGVILLYLFLRRRDSSCSGFSPLPLLWGY